MQRIVNYISKFIEPKAFVYGGLLIGVIFFFEITLQRGNYVGIAVASLPFIILIISFLFKRPIYGFIGLFIANYFVMGATRYVSFPGGVFMDIIIAFCFILLFIKSAFEKVEWKRALSPLTLITFTWFLFCIFELLNPRAVSIADWASKVRGMAVYPFIMAILAPVLLGKYKHLRVILVIWSALTLLGALKGFWQKNHGFDSAELFWLNEGGGGATHLISSGIRYFSFFTDAGNYGSSMGFSMVVFSTVAFFIKNKWLKIYFFIAAFAGGYGMSISGTRGALAVPFAGYALLAILSKNWKITITALFIITSTFLFLNFTNYGNSNQQIRRMRSAFDQNDASLNVRLVNQKKLKEYLADSPFGTSIGFYGKTVDRNNYYYEVSKIPSDSWYVQVWIQTGIVGLILYLTLLIISLILAGYIILFKINNKNLRGILAGLLAGTFGMFISAYGNDLLAQFPNCFLFYICLAFVYMGKYYDKELEEYEQLT